MGETSVRILSPQERPDALRVRLAVFVEEQGIPVEEEIDDLDDVAVHCALYAGGEPVATGRMTIDGTLAKIGRMAVLAPHRGRGYGALVLAELEREGVARGLRAFKLSAQEHAIGFYERAGYTAYGDFYDDVGIPHRDMKKELPG